MNTPWGVKIVSRQSGGKILSLGSSFYKLSVSCQNKYYCKKLFDTNTSSKWGMFPFVNSHLIFPARRRVFPAAVAIGRWEFPCLVPLHRESIDQPGRKLTNHRPALPLLPSAANFRSCAQPADGLSLKSSERLCGGDFEMGSETPAPFDAVCCRRATLILSRLCVNSRD